LTIEKYHEIARGYAENTNQDIYFLSGEIERPLDIRFMRLIDNNKLRDNALLMLVTPGGNADASYRIARCLQDSYDKVTVFVSGWCKSAGTLCAIGAHKIIMSKEGELGPLDVQLGRKDDLVGYESGLEIEAALGSLKGYVAEHFDLLMLGLIAKSEGRISVATASQISSNIVIGVFSGIYSQIDPTKIGEVARSMMIARDYGKRLASHSDNLQSDEGIDLLVQSYCSHGFVIDFREAETIFKCVERPDEGLLALHKAMGRMALVPSPPGAKVILECLSRTHADPSLDDGPTIDEKEETDAGPEPKDAPESGEGAPSGDSAGSTSSVENPTEPAPDAE
jgi:hypothetical protein